MNSITLQASPREQLGKKEATKSRKENMVPCVLYGGEDTVHFLVDVRAFDKLVYTAEVFFVDIEVGGKTYRSVMKEIQFHPVTDKILHVDFIQVFEDKAVTVELPVKVHGNSVGVRAGGKLRLNSRKLKVKGLPSALPVSIEVDIAKLNIGQTIKVGELNVENLQILAPANSVVVAVKTSRKAMAAAGDGEDDEEEGAEA